MMVAVFGAGFVPQPPQSVQITQRLLIGRSFGRHSDPLPRQRLHVFMSHPPASGLRAGRGRSWLACQTAVADAWLAFTADKPQHNVAAMAFFGHA